MKVFPETEYKNNSEMAELAPGKDSTKESKKATTNKGIKATAKKISKDSTVKKAPKVKAVDKKDSKKSLAKKTIRTSETEKNSVIEVPETQSEAIQSQG